MVKIDESDEFNHDLAILLDKHKKYLKGATHFDRTDEDFICLRVQYAFMNGSYFGYKHDKLVKCTVCDYYTWDFEGEDLGEFEPYMPCSEADKKYEPCTGKLVQVEMDSPITWLKYPM